MFRGKGKYYCSVPLCTNTSLSAPQLLFFSLPRDETRRNLWYDACRRKDRYSITTNSWVCEEHFNPQDDYENYLSVQLTQARPRLKSTAIPSKFDCQNIHGPTKKRLLEVTPSTSKSVSLAEDSTGFCVVKNEPEDVEDTANPNSVTPGVFAFVKLEEAPSSQFLIENNGEQESEASGFPAESIECLPDIPIPSRSLLTKPRLKKSGRPRQLKHFRSKAVQVNMMQSQDQECFTQKTLTPATEDSSSKLATKYENEESSSFSEASESEDDGIIKHSILEFTRMFNKKRPMYYLGVRDDCSFLMPLLEKRMCFNGLHLTKYDVVTLILRKIRLNCSFAHLGDDYGIEESYAAKIFIDHIKYVSSSFSQLVLWSPPDSVFANLPLVFWREYQGAYVIIHMYTIKIQKRDESKCQEGFKYLVGMSPGGLMMYVSKGFSDKLSDLQVTEQSGFLDNVSGKTIMTIKGFENLESHLTKINTKLIRLPLVDEKDQLDPPQSSNSEEEDEESDDPSFSREKNEMIVKFYKQQRDMQIRIHVEKGFGRLRQFEFFAPHTIIPQQLKDCVDDAMKIACGLVNTYTPLGKS